MRRPSPALIVSILALVMATAGTATAAKVLVKSSGQVARGAINGGDVADGAISRRDLRSDAVNGDKVRNGSLGAEELSFAARSELKGAGTTALEAYRKSGPNDIAASTPATVATLADVPPGTYAILAKTLINAKQGGRFFNEGTTIAGHCALDAAGDVDHGRGLLGAPGAESPGSIHMQLTRTFTKPGSVSITCDVNQATWSAGDTSIIAIRLAEAPRTHVNG